MENLKQAMRKLQKQMAQKSEQVLRNQISKLPESMQESVLACFEASKHTNPRGRRYNQKWTKDAVNKFFDLLEAAYAKYNFPPNRIYNVDETGR